MTSFPLISRRLRSRQSPQKLWSLALFGVMGATLLTGCSKPTETADVQPLVKVIKVSHVASNGARSYSGDVRARFDSTLGFRVGGKLVARLVDVGATVKRGQVLARLDAADAALQVVQAETQRTLAEAEAARYRELKVKGFISQSALDGKEATLKSAQAQSGLARNQSAYTTLLADRDGVVAAVLAEPGQVVTAGQPIIRLAQAGEREVAVSLPEDAIAGIRVGQAATVELWRDDEHYFHGVVREISPVADPATRTYPVRVSLSGVAADLPLGLSASVAFPAQAGDDVIRVPLSALFDEQGHTKVWALTPGGLLSAQEVTVRSYGDKGAVISAGLNDGTQVVVAGVHKLHSGQRVRVYAEPDSKPTTAAPVGPTIIIPPISAH